MRTRMEHEGAGPPEEKDHSWIKSSANGTPRRGDLCSDSSAARTTSPRIDGDEFLTCAFKRLHVCHGKSDAASHPPGADSGLPQPGDGPPVPWHRHSIHVGKAPPFPAQVGPYLAALPERTPTPIASLG